MWWGGGRERDRDKGRGRDSVYVEVRQLLGISSLPTIVRLAGLVANTFILLKNPLALHCLSLLVYHVCSVCLLG